MTIAIENLNAVIFAVGHIYITVIVQFNSMGYIKFAGTISLFYPIQKDIFLQRKILPRGCYRNHR